MRRAAHRGLLGLACAASLASPPAGPDTTQAPLWEGEAYQSAGAPVRITEGSPLVAAYTASLTIPSRGSGASTSRLALRAAVSEHGAATLRGALTDGDGALLAEGEAVDDPTGADPEAGLLELSARDVLASCEPGERCTVPLGFELAVEGEPLELYWELWLSARDATVGADAEWVEVQLNPAGG